MGILYGELAEYFFGTQYDVKVAEGALAAHPGINQIVAEMKECIRQRVPHLGLQLVGFTDLDTGATFCALKICPGALSMASFYISSSHRFFGGQSLVCVPIQYLSPFMTVDGDYIVYRHTFKEPVLSDEEYQRSIANGTHEERIRMWTFCRSREGFRTMPGKSYVGLTRRSWNKRYVEHLEAAMEKQSSTLFHSAVREMEGRKVVCVHDVSLFGATKVQATAVEKELIRRSTLYPLGLNMKVG